MDEPRKERFTAGPGREHPRGDLQIRSTLLGRTDRVEPHTITLRPMKRKWASCSSKGNLSFDTDLLRQPAEFRRQAIVHELLHLKYPNHGKMFWALEKVYLENP